VSTGLPLATATSAPAGDTLPTAAATSPVESPANPSGPAQTTAAPAGTQPSAAPAPAISLGDFSSAVRQVAGRVKPAVVQITNEQVQLGQFNQPFTTPAGVGSGVIYDQQGHILTNNHVVTGAQRLLVSLPDGRSFQGKLIGTDPQTDLAVIQISGSNLPVAQLGDSRQLQVGDWVVAIGNALALPGGPTVSVGVVSALGRTIQEPSSSSSSSSGGPLLYDLIQTDAPINPGNSGGALVNLAGQVIGINTLVAGQAEPGVQAQGIGFAISVTTARPVADQLVAKGHVDHPYVGINYQPLNPAIAAQLGISQTQGVILAQIVPGSPAEKAGMQPNDVITAVDGKKLVNDSDLGLFLNSHRPGDKVSFTVERSGQTLNVQVTLGTMPAGLNP
ncbi:MAG TPA: trypsin-like peptidase domain-containing protein, partial [Anaerolineaceae bacterium]